MESAIIAALIASGISLVGLLANLHIAEQTRKASFSLKAFENSLMQCAKQTEKIDYFLEKAERLRIEYFQTIHVLSNYLSSRNLNPKTRLSDILDKLNLFTEKYDSFCDSWSSIAPDMKDGITMMYRIFIHKNAQYRMIIHKISNEISYMINNEETGENDNIIYKKIEHLLEVLNYFELEINGLYSSVTNEKQRIINENYKTSLTSVIDKI